jgi:hypothetical protein
MFTPFRRDLPRRARDEAGQTRARRVRQAQRRDRRLDRLRGDVDHPAPAPVDHARQDRGHQGDGRQHVGVERLDEILAPPVGPEPRRRAARVGHEDVDITRRRQDLGATLVAGDIGGDRRHRHAIGVADMLRRRLQRLRPAGVQDQIDARLRQRLGAAPAKPLRRRADQRAFSLDTQIHAGLPFVFRPSDSSAPRAGPVPQPMPKNSSRTILPSATW